MRSGGGSMLFGSRFTISFEIVRSQLVAGLALLFAMAMPGLLGSETFSLSAFYPGAFVPAVTYRANSASIGYTNVSNVSTYNMQVSSASVPDYAWLTASVPAISRNPTTTSATASNPLIIGAPKGNLNLLPATGAIYLNGTVQNMCEWKAALSVHTLLGVAQGTYNCDAAYPTVIALATAPNLLTYRRDDIYTDTTKTIYMLCCNFGVTSN